MDTQLQFIHFTAYILDLINYNTPLTPTFEQKLEVFIRNAIGEKEYIHFLDYRHKSDHFNSTKAY